MHSVVTTDNNRHVALQSRHFTSCPATDQIFQTGYNIVVATQSCPTADNTHFIVVTTQSCPTADNKHFIVVTTQSYPTTYNTHLYSGYNAESGPSTDNTHFIVLTTYNPVLLLTIYIL